jgi:hypothetical protein
MFAIGFDELCFSLNGGVSIKWIVRRMLQVLRAVTMMIWPGELSLVCPIFVLLI